MQDYVIADPRFASMVLGNAGLELLAEGFRWTEGPVWFADHGCLLFSDIPNDRIMRWTEAGASVFRGPAGFTNGLARDRQGRLISCSHQNRRVERTEYDGAITVLADGHDGKKLNAPNDVVVRSDGSIWFTDPIYGISTDYEGGKQTPELPARVYRIDPAGQLTIAAGGLVGPNGLCFSPDESKLYVCESGHQFDDEAPRHIRVFSVSRDGKLDGGRHFHTVKPGFADGITCDSAGNIWSSAAGGVHCIAPDGTLLGIIAVPGTVSNITFGGRHLSRLFICAGRTLYAIYTNVRGATWP